MILYFIVLYYVFFMYDITIFFEYHTVYDIIILLEYNLLYHS